MKETVIYGYGANIKGVELDFIKYTDETKTNIKKLSGIYIAFNSDDEIIYVGESKNLRYRVPTHFGMMGKFHEELAYMRIAYVEADRYERHILEGILVQKYQPKYNSSDKDINVKNTLSKEIVKDIIYYGKVKKYTPQRIAEGLGVSKTSVKRYCDCDVKLPEDYKPTKVISENVTKKQYAKITTQLFYEIRDAIEESFNVSNKELADRFNTYPSMISSIKNLSTPIFKTWEKQRKRVTA